MQRLKFISALCPTLSKEKMVLKTAYIKKKYCHNVGICPQWNKQKCPHFKSTVAEWKILGWKKKWNHFVSLQKWMCFQLQTKENCRAFSVSATKRRRRRRQRRRKGKKIRSEGEEKMMRIEEWDTVMVSLSLSRGQTSNNPTYGPSLDQLRTVIMCEGTGPEVKSGPVWLMTSLVLLWVVWVLQLSSDVFSCPVSLDSLFLFFLNRCFPTSGSLPHVGSARIQMGSPEMS